MIIAQGGAFGDWALYTKDGKPTYCHNLLGLQRFKVKADKPVPPGAHKVDGIRLRERWPGKGGRVRLYIDGNHVRRGKAPGDCATDLLRG